MFEEEDVAEYRLKNALHYLQNLSTLTHVPNLNFHHFTILLKFDDQAKWDKSLSQIATIIFDLLNKHGQNVHLCTELCTAFWIIVSSKWPTIVENFIESNIDKSFLWLYPLMKNVSKENELIMYSGMMAYVANYEYEFSNQNLYYKIDSRMKEEISRRLTNVKFIDVVLRMVDLWLDLLLAKPVERKAEEIKDILTSLLAVATVFWNHDFAHRSKMEPVVMKSLQFDYNESRKKINYDLIDHTRIRFKYISEFSYIFADMTIFKYMMDISWKVPFKYFICRYLLKFAISCSHLEEMVRLIDDLRVGLAKNLRNKNVVRVETELFTFCLNHFKYDQWKFTVDGVIPYELLEKSSAAYIARWWLPHIVKKFPNYIPELLNYLENSSEDIRHAVEIPLLKICYYEKIPLAITEDEESLIYFLVKRFAVAEELRGDVFSVFCDLHDQSVLPTELELGTVLEFLKQNINSNCTLFRQLMLSAFSRFILRLICSCVKVIKKSESEVDERLNPVLKFLQNFNDLITDGMQPGCSYQRKVTTLNLYKILMTYAVHDCGSSIHKSNLKDAEKFANFAKERNAWFFQSNVNRKLLFNCLMDFFEEIQNLASLLLRNYFVLKGEFEAGMFEEAMQILHHNRFYKRSSGVAAVISLISMASNPMNGPRTVKIEYSSFSELFLKVLESKVEIIEKDILDAAVNHPLDGDIRVLNFLITDQSSPEGDRVTEEQVERLIKQLETIVPLLLKALFVDVSADYAPSFEESDLALRLLIKNSFLQDTIRLDDEQDQCQFHPLNQILLNFIWITLKACCELESNLITNRTNLLSEKQLIRCCNLVVNTLKLCRHKGVIEAAGIALSNVVKTLTAQNLCIELLESVVFEVLHLIEFKSGATISRKSAGLSLLIQNIVSGDKRPDKPLVAKCWTEFKRILDVDFDTLKVDVSREIPQTHALHFLKVIVGDARNNTELQPFIEEITTLCLTTLKAPVWLIRNAALQLFGTLLLKIVGQRNVTPEVGVRCTFEEIFLTMPRILDHIILTVEQATEMRDGSVQHADLAPILTILMNVRLISTVVLDQALHEKLLKLRILIEDLLASNLYTIRELASKALLALYSLSDSFRKKDDLSEKIVEYVIHGKGLRGENHVHGCLLALKQIHDLYLERLIYNLNFKRGFTQKCVTLEQSLNVSLVSQALLFEMGMITIQPMEVLIQHINNVLNKVSSKCYLSIGYDQWLHAVMKHTLDNGYYPDVIGECLKYSNSAILLACLDILYEPHRSFGGEDEDFDLLLKCMENYLEQNNTNVVIQIMKTFTDLYDSKYDFYCEKFANKYFGVLIKLDYYQFQGSNVQMLAIVSNKANTNWYVVLEVIYETLDITKYNKNIRLNSARAMLLLCEKFKNYRDYHHNFPKITWKILLNIVQDEEPDVRSIGSECFTKIFQMLWNYGPEYTMNQLFDPDIVLKHLDRRDFIDELWNKVKIDCSFPAIHSEEISNPFDQGIKNCYEEQVKMVQLAGEALLKMLERDFDICKEYFSSCVFDYDFYSELKNNLGKFFICAEEYVWCLKCYYSCGIYKILNSSEDFDECLQMLEQVVLTIL